MKRNKLNQIMMYVGYAGTAYFLYNLYENMGTAQKIGKKPETTTQGNQTPV